MPELRVNQSPIRGPGTSVSNQLDKVTDKNSGLVQRARRSGQQFANQRGLINSSGAARAGESAALDYALPPSQEATIASQFGLQQQEGSIQQKLETLRGDIQSRLQREGYGQDIGRIGATGTQDRLNIGATGSERLKQIAAEASEGRKSAEQGFGFQRQLQTQAEQFQSGQSAQDRALQRETQIRELQERENLSRIEAEQRLTEQAQGFGFQKSLQTQAEQFQSGQSAADRALAREQQIRELQERENLSRIEAEQRLTEQEAQFGYTRQLSSQEARQQEQLQRIQGGIERGNMIAEYEQRGVLSSQEAQQQRDTMAAEYGLRAGLSAQEFRQALAQQTQSEQFQGQQSQLDRQQQEFITRLQAAEQRNTMIAEYEQRGVLSAQEAQQQRDTMAAEYGLRSGLSDQEFRQALAQQTQSEQFQGQQSQLDRQQQFNLLKEEISGRYDLQSLQGQQILGQMAKQYGFDQELQNDQQAFQESFSRQQYGQDIGLQDVQFRNAKALKLTDAQIEMERREDQQTFEQAQTILQGDVQQEMLTHTSNLQQKRDEFLNNMAAAVRDKSVSQQALRDYSGRVDQIAEGLRTTVTEIATSPDLNDAAKAKLIQQYIRDANDSIGAQQALLAEFGLTPPTLQGQESEGLFADFEYKQSYAPAEQITPAEPTQQEDPQMEWMRTLITQMLGENQLGNNGQDDTPGGPAPTGEPAPAPTPTGEPAPAPTPTPTGEPAPTPDPNQQWQEIQRSGPYQSAFQTVTEAGGANGVTESSVRALWQDAQRTGQTRGLTFTGHGDGDIYRMDVQPSGDISVTKVREGLSASEKAEQEQAKQAAVEQNVATINDNMKQDGGLYNSIRSAFRTYGTSNTSFEDFMTRARNYFTHHAKQSPGRALQTSEQLGWRNGVPFILHVSAQPDANGVISNFNIAVKDYNGKTYPA